MAKDSNYNPIFQAWKWGIPILISLFLLAGIIVVCITFQSFTQHYPSNGIIYLMIIHSVIALTVFICLCMPILKLIGIYAQNMERERGIMAELYIEEQKKKIIKQDKFKEQNQQLKEANETIKSLTTEKEEWEKAKNEELNKKYLEKEIDYLRKINEKLIEKQPIIK